MAIAYQSPVTNQGFASNANSRTVSVTVNSGSNQILVACIAIETKTRTVSSATYGGVSLTKLDSQAAASFGNQEVWYLKAPTAGTANLVVNFSSSDFHDVIGALVASGVDQTTPFRAVSKGAVNSTTNSRTVASVASGDLVFGAMTVDGTGHSITPGANETEEYDTISDSGANTGWLGTQAGADGGVIAPTWTSTSNSAMVACALIPAGGGTDATVTHVVGNLTLGATAPTVSSSAAVAHTAGGLTLGATAPTISAVTPVAHVIGNLPLGATAPSIDYGASISHVIGNLVLGATAPTIDAGTIVTHVIGNLTLGASAPAVSSSASVAHVAGNLTLSGGTHSTGSDGTVAHVIGNLTLGAVAPTLNVGGSVAHTIGNISFGGGTHTISGLASQPAEGTWPYHPVATRHHR